MIKKVTDNIILNLDKIKMVFFTPGTCVTPDMLTLVFDDNTEKIYEEDAVELWKALKQLSVTRERDV
jgi:hypothetical protein